ncbi:uncharacterized protein LOC110455694 [Mizuhopecten yessoensis]|uniref:B-cell lymphoma 3 protein-like n=1 Tax=Mizuhopecten yessoensis TaxID=6573 RepID=A0A210R3Y3_MIZYE|nr:uncharacterized protein LOC110455694 [Mizuhopecten yessoensis]OWF55780.1 B-cell lymphoma 3 protein-like [Mizuhopecten yessoensis]
MIETRVKSASKMSGKRNKSGQKSPGHVVASAENLAEKERADRIAAAEAMSCLSSVILLSSDLEKDFNAASPPKEASKGQKRTRNSQKSPQGNKTGTESKRGKSRSGRGRGARSANHQRGDSSVRPSGSPQGVNNMVEGVKNAAHEVSRVGGRTDLGVGVKRSLEGKAMERVMPLRQETHSRVASVPPRSRQGGVVAPSTNPNPVIPSALQIAILSKLNATARDHRQTSGEHLVLKLPLVINNDNAEVKSLTSQTAMVSPASVTSTDSVEFTQSTVEKLLQPPYNSNKFDSLDSALPLKKRKLLSYLNIDTTVNEESVPMETSQETKLEQAGDVIDLTKVKVEPESTLRQQVQAAPPSVPTVPEVPINVTPVTSATLNPVSVDPRTSLMLLTEMQVALQQDEDGDLPLHIAVAQENIVMVQKFVHLMSISGKSVDKYNKAQQTPLHLAVELDFVDAVKTLLFAKANPNLVNKRGENAVHLAVKVQSSACLKYMIQHSQNKTDLNTRNFEGLAPLHTAVERNDIMIVDMLLRAGADINILDGKSGKTPLFYSVEHNYLPMVEFLQVNGANVDLANYAGITVVMAAQARGFQEAATLLLKGMDSQAYHELKDMTPTKKIPIPRIPSKSHLIIGSDNLNTSGPKTFRLTDQNTDSNSSESLSSVRPYHGAIARCLGSEPLAVPDFNNIKKEMNSDSRFSGYQLINVVPTNMLNGLDQSDHMIPQSQSRPENNSSELPRKVSPATVPHSVSRQGFESNGSTPSPHRDIKHIPDDIHHAQPPKSYGHTHQNQTESRLIRAIHPQSEVQTPASQAQSLTSQVQSSQHSHTPSLQSSVLTLPLHHNFIHNKTAMVDPQPGDSNQPRREHFPRNERHSHYHKESSPHPRDSSPRPKESSVHPMNISSHPRESSQYPVNSSPNQLNNSQNLVNTSPDFINSTSKAMNSSLHPGGNYHLKDNSDQSRGSSPHQRDSSPHRANQQRRLVKVSASGKMHVEKAGSGSKGQSSGSSKGSMPSSQMYHLTNISKSTASILAAKLQGIYTSKAGQASRPLNLSTSIPDSVNAKVKEET